MDKCCFLQLIFRGSRIWKDILILAMGNQTPQRLTTRYFIVDQRHSMRRFAKRQGQNVPNILDGNPMTSGADDDIPSSSGAGRFAISGIILRLAAATCLSRYIDAYDVSKYICCAGGDSLLIVSKYIDVLIFQVAMLFFAALFVRFDMPKMSMSLPNCGYRYALAFAVLNAA